jgi:hypothetical protein
MKLVRLPFTEQHVNALRRTFKEVRMRGGHLQHEEVSSMPVMGSSVKRLPCSP